MSRTAFDEEPPPLQFRENLVAGREPDIYSAETADPPSLLTKPPVVRMNFGEPAELNRIDELATAADNPSIGRATGAGIHHEATRLRALTEGISEGGSTGSAACTMVLILWYGASTPHRVTSASTVTTVKHSSSRPLISLRCIAVPEHAAPRLHGCTRSQISPISSSVSSSSRSLRWRRPTTSLFQ